MSLLSEFKEDYDIGITISAVLKISRFLNKNNMYVFYYCWEWKIKIMEEWIEINNIFPRAE